MINGILKGQVMDGVCTILHKDNDFNLSYSYKDKEMSFVPIISFPSNVLSFVFKRRFSPSDKLRADFATLSTPVTGMPYTSTQLVTTSKLKLVMIPKFDLRGHPYGLEKRMAK